ncbi:MAG: NTP transferase domain-containing protein [Gammaproteobacteria bacterium]|nr:NTP transferase domain-containing protein [Gammaproteobacteria bacterium]
MTASPIYGLVLAGGESRRMGQDKALLARDGQSQLAHMVELLGRVTDRVFVSARAEQQQESERRRFAQIIDRVTGIGPVAGILAALHEYPQADWLVVACDLPNIDRATLEFLLEQRSAEEPFTAFKSSYDGLPEPLCALYRSGSEAIIQEFVDAGIVCPRKILIRSATRLLEQPNPRSLDNVNTPDDLEQSVLEAAS